MKKSLDKKICPILFSGHNERAVITLCRHLSESSVRFYIVARDREDVIFKTKWRKNVIVLRQTSDLTTDLMSHISQAVQNRGLIPALCPTSEFLNQFFLTNAEDIQNQGWHLTLPSSDIYLSLSDKLYAPGEIESLAGIRAPDRLPDDYWTAPCVLKPKTNIQEGTVHYPIICRTQKQLQDSIDKIHPSRWFAQKWVDGRSIYLCAYLDRQGGWNAYWQENLLQQSGGKSIVLAHTCENPGIDVSELMQGLKEKRYSGPFMMEIIITGKGELKFIEVNPRFWGPLELARKALPNLISRFFSDLQLLQPPQEGSANNDTMYWYSWEFGARQSTCRKFSGTDKLDDSIDMTELLIKHDIYAQEDTKELHRKH